MSAATRAARASIARGEQVLARAELLAEPAPLYYGGGIIFCNRFGIMVRPGVHCAEPLARHFGERSLVRISLYLYNTPDEVGYIAESLRKLARSFS
jgi:hypothetical protein